MKQEIADITPDLFNATSFSQQTIAEQSAVNDGAFEPTKSRIRNAISRFVVWMRSFGPYVAIELLLPGGSIIAVALWTYRHRFALRSRDSTPQSASVKPARAQTLACVGSCHGR